jgi:hypothetical protein
MLCDVLVTPLLQHQRTPAVVRVLFDDDHMDCFGEGKHDREDSESLLTEEQLVFVDAEAAIDAQVHAYEYDQLVLHPHADLYVGADYFVTTDKPC